MKKIMLISGIVAITLTTASADFSFAKMYEELKAVAEATDVNVSHVNESNSTNSTTVVESNSTDINSSKSEISLDVNVSDENNSQTSTK